MSSIEEVIQQRTFRSPQQKAMINILYTASWLYSIQRDIFKDEEITHQQYNVLRILRGQKGQPISTCDIRDRMLDRSSDVSRLVDRLAKMGLVSRQTCQADKRRIDVLLSAKGDKLLQKLTPLIEEMEAKLNISSEAAERLSEALDQFRTDQEVLFPDKAPAQPASACDKLTST